MEKIHCKVNQKLILIKVYYFAFYAAQGPILPYLMVLGRQLGISEVLMGTVSAVLPIFYMLAKPAFGYLADRFSNHRKLIFILLLVMQAIAYLTIYFVPPLHKTSWNARGDLDSVWRCGTISEVCSVQENITCHVTCNNAWTCHDSDSLEGNSTKIANVHIEFGDENNFCELSQIEDHNHGQCLVLNSVKAFTMNSSQCHQHSCQVSCPELNECFEKETLSTNETLKNFIFWIFFTQMLLSSIGFNVVQSISDAICCDILGEENLAAFGYQRVWGTIGWGFTGILAGWLMDTWSDGKTDVDFAPAFILLLVSFVGCIGCAVPLKLPVIPQSQNILKDVTLVFKEFRSACFIVFVVIYGMVDGVFIYFHFWYLEDLAVEYSTHNMKLLQGLCLGVQTFLGELPFLVVSGWVFKKIGHANTLSLVFLLYGIRDIFYSILINPWWTLPIEVLGGPCYGLFYASLVTYTSEVSPPGTSATMQSVVGSAFDGLGYIMGAFLGGAFFRMYGGRATFRGFGLVSVFCAVLHALLYHLFIKKRHRGRKDKNAKYCSPENAMQVTCKPED